MAAVVRGGPLRWSMSRDDEGHREYKITYQVECTSVADGPANALRAPGLPVPGSYWVIGNDVDLWATCRWNATVTPRLEREPNRFFDVEFTFSTKPISSKACKELEFEDPLLEPPKVSGGAMLRQWEGTGLDRFGRAMTNSAWEQMKGPYVEFDFNTPEVTIERNIASFSLITLAYRMLDSVNIAPLWGVPRRCVKLSEVKWEQKFHGQCHSYYTLTLKFQISADTFDRDILDEGDKVLSGKWNVAGAWIVDTIDGAPANPNNPAHFIKSVDKAGNPVHIILNGRGVPAEVMSGSNQLYISIVNSNVGNPLSRTSRWISITSGTSVTWKEDDIYQRGAVIDFVGVSYVAINDPPIGQSPALNPDWADLGVLPLGPRNKDNYSPLISYSKGDYVRDIAQTGAGYRHIEKYPESNFLLLGIPVIL